MVNDGRAQLYKEFLRFRPDLERSFLLEYRHSLWKEWSQPFETDAATLGGPGVLSLAGRRNFDSGRIRGSQRLPLQVRHLAFFEPGESQNTWTAREDHGSTSSDVKAALFAIWEAFRQALALLTRAHLYSIRFFQGGGGYGK